MKIYSTNLLSSALSRSRISIYRPRISLKIRRDEKSAENFGVRFDETTADTLGIFSVVGKYNVVLYLSYERIRAITDYQNSNKKCVQLAVFVISCAVGLNRLYLVLLGWKAVLQCTQTSKAPWSLPDWLNALWRRPWKAISKNDCVWPETFRKKKEYGIFTTDTQASDS